MPSTRRKTNAARLGALALISCPATLFANGFEIPENGTRALGRGGAYVASVDEPSALYFNPAGLTRIRNHAVTFNLNLVDDRVRFQRDPFVFSSSGGPINNATRREVFFEPVEDQEGPFPAPMLFAASNFGLENWTLGAGVYGPSAMGRKRFPSMTVRPADFQGSAIGTFIPGRDQPVTRAGGQSYMVREYDLLLFYPSLAAAYRIDPINLSIGVTAQMAFLNVNYDMAVDGLFGPGSVFERSQENDDLFATTRLEVSGYSFTGILGLMWDPSERFSIGASYRPRFRVRAEGDVDITFPQQLLSANPRVDDTSVTLITWLPDVVRLGGVYRHLDASGRQLFDIGLDVVYEGWSINEGFDVRLAGRINDDAGGVDNQKLPDLFLRRNYNDVFSVRLGSDLTMLRDAETGNGPVFRLGGYWESAASPNEWTNLDFLALERYAGTVGFSYHIGRWSIDLAYALAVSPTRVVTDGRSEILAPTWVCYDPPNADVAAQCAGVEPPVHPVNNGTYEFWAQTFSIGTTWGW